MYMCFYFYARHACELPLVIHVQPYSFCFMYVHILGIWPFGFVEPQKYHILFIFPIPFVTLFLSYPSIKPLTFTTFIINMGLYYHFPNHLFFNIWVNLWLIIEKNNIFSLYFKFGWVWWCLQVYLKTLTSSKVTTYPQIRI